MDFFFALGFSRKTRTAVPRSTLRPVSGIWLRTTKLSAASSGCVAPSTRPDARNRSSAFTRVRSLSRGTSTIASLVATTMLTDESFSTFAPASGDCSMTVPGVAGLSFFCTGWLRTRSFARSVFSAANVSLAPVSCGTRTSRGHSR